MIQVALARVTTVVIVVAVVGLAGCGGDSRETAGSSTSAGTQPSRSAEDRPAGLRGALIGLGDLSSGWKREPTIDTGLSCGSFDPFGAATRVVDSGSFHRGYAFLQETVGLFDSEEASGRAYRELASGRAERCVRRTMYRRMQFESGASTAFVEPVEVGRVDTLGPQSRAVRYTVTFRGEVGSGEAYIVAMSARAGSSVASLTAISSFEPLAEEAYEELGEMLNDRLESALG